MQTLPIHRLGAIALVLILGACSQNAPESGGGGNDNDAPTSESEATQPAELEFPILDWAATPLNQELASQVGQTFDFSCSPGGVSNSIWGTGIYTSDSSICTAAVHSGLFSPETGGNLTLEILPGQAMYFGSEHHDIASDNYGPWSGSFRFPEGNLNETETFPTIQWDATPGSFGISSRASIGDRHQFSCAPGSSLDSAIWGTDVYTNDSSICVAAIHAGKITATTGGTITIEIAPGEESYQGSERNGVSTADYGAWSSSFIFVDE